MSVWFLSDEAKRELRRQLEPKFTKGELATLRRMSKQLAKYVRLAPKEPSEETPRRRADVTPRGE